MDYKEMLAKNPGRFMEAVKAQTGNARIWRDADLSQVFWLGVLKGTQKVDWTDSPIKYLVVRGFGEVRDYLYSQRLRTLVKRCVDCGKEQPYRRMVCKCGGELVLESRVSVFMDRETFDRDTLDDLEVEQFVSGLTGRMHYVARRWLLERADLYFDNHLEQIAKELGISAVAVSNYKVRVRETFRLWRKA